MGAAELPVNPEAEEVPPGQTSQRRVRDDGGDIETGTPRRKRRRTTASAALSGHSIIEDEELSLFGATIPVCSQVDLFDHAPLAGVRPNRLARLYSTNHTHMHFGAVEAFFSEIFSEPYLTVI